jgi:hypothetical protein
MGTDSKPAARLADETAEEPSAPGKLAKLLTEVGKVEPLPFTYADVASKSYVQIGDAVEFVLAAAAGGGTCIARSVRPTGVPTDVPAAKPVWTRNENLRQTVYAKGPDGTRGFAAEARFPLRAHHITALAS